MRYVTHSDDPDRAMRDLDSMRTDRTPRPAPKLPRPSTHEYRGTVPGTCMMCGRVREGHRASA